MGKWNHILVLLAISLNANAQFFRNYGPADGLSNQHIRAITQGPDRFLWVATAEGLNRFDGELVKPYLYDPNDAHSLPNDQVEEMAFTPDGRLWFTSVNGQLSVYDPLTDHFSTWEQLTGMPDPSKGKSTWAIHCASNDSIYVGCSRSGLILYLPSEKKTVILGPTDDQKTRTPTVLLPDVSHAHLLWMAWYNELHLYHMRSGKFLAHQLPNRTETGEPVKVIQDIHADEDGTLWLATWGGGLLAAKSGDASWKEYLFDPKRPLDGGRNVFKEIVAQSPERLLIASDRGLIEFDRSSGEMHLVQHDPKDAHSLASGWANTVAVDDEGTVWVGTYQGLSAWDKAQNRFTTIRISNPADKVHPKPFLNGVGEVNSGFVAALQMVRDS